MLLQVEKSTSTNPMKGGHKTGSVCPVVSTTHHQIFCLGYNVARGWFLLLLCQDKITSMIWNRVRCLIVSHFQYPILMDPWDHPQWSPHRGSYGSWPDIHPAALCPKPCTHSGLQDSKSLCSNDPRQKAQGPAAQQGPWTSSMPISSETCDSTKVTNSTMRDWLVATHWWTSQWMQWASIKHDVVVTGILLGLHTVGSRRVHVADSTGLPQPASITDGHSLNQLAPPLQGSHLIEIWPFNIGIGSSPGYTTGTHNHITIWVPKGPRV